MSIGKRLATAILLVLTLVGIVRLGCGTWRGGGFRLDGSEMPRLREVLALRRGMSLEEVSSLLGKPRRTSLRDVSGSPGGAAQGLLQWLYSWEGSDRGALRIEFIPKAEGAWTVSSWDWASY